jgi:MoxR-like ATPase
MSIAEVMEKRAQQFVDRYTAVREQVQRVIVGHDEIVHGVLTCLFAGGHCLLEGVPGLGKTLLVRTLAKALDLDFNRVQFTPDLMPADILGTNMVMESPDGKRFFEFQKGPIFTQICLADEINRATPKTQSAMLETMQEGAITAAGVRYQLKKPFLVMATQNPIEQEGTYPLPEASWTASSSSSWSATPGGRNWPRSSIAPRAAKSSSRPRSWTARKSSSGKNSSAK